MLGALMFCSKLIMEAIPNIHLLGMLTMVFTLVFRKKALFPIYIFVLLTGLYAGFSLWWIPHLYLWTLLWGITMLLPKTMPRGIACLIYPAVCALHGLAYGTLYAPAQALMFGLNFEEMLTWIAVGFPWDIAHAVGNLLAGLLIFPLCEILRRLKSRLP
jgi:energy-coupling factor transport system substrate-specific component